MPDTEVSDYSPDTANRLTDSEQPMDAFLLTSHWQEIPSSQASLLTFWWKTPAGIVRHRLEESAVCFVRQDDQARLEASVHTLDWPISFRPLALKNFRQESVSACYMPAHYLYRWRDLLAEQNIDCWEADVRITDRYLMERFVYGAARLVGRIQKSEEANLLELASGRVLPGRYRPSLNWLSLDIETNIPKMGEEFRLFSVGLVTQHHRRVLLVEPPEKAGNGKADNPKTNAAQDSTRWAESGIELCPSEPAVLERLNRLIGEFDPDVIIGWSLVQFDIQVLDQIYRRHGISMCWGRDKSRLTLRKRRDQPDRFRLNLAGRLALDGIEILRAASYDFESFSLQAVAMELLGEGKLLTGSDRGEDIQRLYETDIISLAKYNLQDCELVWRIFQQEKLFDFALERSALTGLTLDRMGGSVAAFENLYLPRLHRAGYVAPNIGDGYSEQKSPGGFVMDSRPGIFDQVLVLDFKSLYPSIIRTFVIDPLGLIEGLGSQGSAEEVDQLVPGFFGGVFHKERHLLPDLIRQLGERRDAAKKAKNLPLSQAIKIIMASCYGVLGSEGCRFHDTRLSASITKRGHQIIQESSDWIESQGHQVIYGDTDSVFVRLHQKLEPRLADACGARLASGLNQWWRERLEAEYGIESFLEIEFETRFQRFFMPALRGADTGSKKRYAGLVVSHDGEPEVIFKGLESVRSDWTPLARGFQQELYRRFFLRIPYQFWIKEYVEQLFEGELDQQLVYQKRIRRPLAEYQQQIPPQVRAAGMLDRWRVQQGLKPVFKERGGWIHYRMGLTGPEPYEHAAELGVRYPISTPDYQHYLDKQIRPIAEALFQFTGDSVEEWLGRQPGLF